MCCLLHHMSSSHTPDQLPIQCNFITKLNKKYLPGFIFIALWHNKCCFPLYISALHEWTFSSIKSTFFLINFHLSSPSLCLCSVCQEIHTWFPETLLAFCFNRISIHIRSMAAGAAFHLPPPYFVGFKINVAFHQKWASQTLRLQHWDEGSPYLHCPHKACLLTHTVGSLPPTWVSLSGIRYTL